MRGRRSRLVVAAVGTTVVGTVAVWMVAPGARQPRRVAPRQVSLQVLTAEIEAGRRPTPLVGEPGAGGERTVTFLAKRAGGGAPRVVSDVTGWGEHAEDNSFDFSAGTMMAVPGTDWYSLRATVAPRARIEYLIAYAPTDYRLDPHNPRQAAGPQFGGAPASEVVMPGYVPPPEFSEPPEADGGRMTNGSFRSAALGESCRLVVYRPRGYPAGGPGRKPVPDWLSPPGSKTSPGLVFAGDRRYPLVVFSSGRTGPVSRVLDWLIAHGEIQPVVAVFIDPGSLGDSSRAGVPMRRFLTKELLDWLAPRYSVTRSAADRAIIGVSFGAKDALDAAAASAEGFGRLGLLIPGRRIGAADIAALGRSAHRLRVAIVAGRYDQANINTARSVRTALADAGHGVSYTEVPEGHSPTTWIYSLRVVLSDLFGRVPAGGSARETP